MQARTLTEDDLTPWGARMPGYVPRVALPIVLGGLIAASIGVNVVTQATTTAEQTRGWASPIDAAAYGAAIAAVVMLPLRPRVATWAAVVTSLGMAADPMLPWLRPWWAVAALVGVVVAILDAAGGVRQAVVARGWGAPVVPDLTAGQRRRVLRMRALPVVLGAVALVGVVVSLGFWGRDRTAVEAFRAGALVSDGQVTAVDSGDSWVDVAVNGRVLRVASESTHYDVGQVLGVRFAPDGSRAELLEQAFDPAGAVIPAAGGAVIGLVLLWSEVLRRREVREIVTRGGVAVRLRAMVVAEQKATIQLVAPAVALDLVPSAGSDPGRVVVRLRVRPADHDDDMTAVEEPVEAPAEVADVGPASDAELLEFAHSLAPTGPDVRDDDEAEDVVVVGLTRYGSHPLVLVDDAWLTSVRGAADPWRGRGRVRRPGGVSAWTAFWAAADLRWFRVFRRSGAVAPWLGLPLVYAFFRWTSSVGFDLRLIVLVFTVGTIGYGWMGLVRPRLGLTRTGVWFRQGVLDTFFAWSQVERVVADDGGLVLRLTDDSVAAVGVAKHNRTWLLPGIDDPVEAARVCEQARAAARSSPVAGQTPGLLGNGSAHRHEAGHGRRRVSPRILCAVAWSVAAGLGLLGWIR